MVAKTAFITGGASGIGRAFAEELAEQGAAVILADRQIELAEDVATAIRQAGGQATAQELDVRDPAQFQRVVDDTVARMGRVDYFFNNAGIGVGGEIATYTLADWDDVLDVNVRGVAHGIQAVYPVMRAQRSGHIINTASIAGLLPTG
ncbi:MAG: SDR family NAD(P)-dependent oxidoreductase, partial [Polyangiales bacterium]